MNLHLARSETFSFFGSRRYWLAAKAIVTPAELTVITHHRLERTEIFHDPERDRFERDAERHRQEARAEGIFVTNFEQLGALALAETRSVIAAWRAAAAFNITFADLINGIAIEHASLDAIRDIERILTRGVDTLQATINEAAQYSEPSEDLLAPDDEHDTTTPPSQWTRSWR